MTSDATEIIQTYFSHYALRQYKKGQILIFPGDTLDYVYCLKSGIIKQYATSYRGDEVVVNMLTSPAYFPLAPLFAELPNRYFFKAETIVELYRAPAKETLQFFLSNSDCLHDLLIKVYAGIDGVLARMVYLMTGTAKSRVMYELVIEAKQFGVKNKTGNGMVVKLTEKDLAARVGLSRETINRQIQKLKNSQLIEVKRGYIIVSDITNLETRLNAAK